jgi:hypothetical protein
MVFGVKTTCVVCGVPVTTCVLPALCFEHDPENWREVRDAVARQQSARLNAKPAAEGEEGEHGSQGQETERG